MKSMEFLKLAALCIAVMLFSCEKDAPVVGSAGKGPYVQSSALKSVAALKPNYVYTLAGNPDKNNQDNGKFDQAGFQSLEQLVADDGYLYALDSYSIRKIKISDSTVTTLAGNTLGGASTDGLKEQASFLQPTSIALGPDGNIYVAEFYKVRKVTKEGMVTTVAGSTRGYLDGPAKMAKFGRLISIAVCKDGSIYVIDDENHQIRKISNSGVVSTFTSGGPSGTPSSFWNFTSLSITSNGTLYTSGTGIFKVSSTGNVTTVNKVIPVIGNSLLALNDGSFFISSHNQIQKVSPGGSVSIFAGTPVTDQFGRPAEGPADSVDLHTPSGFAIDNNVLYFAVHPAFTGDPDFPYQQGNVIQMIALPKQ